MKNQLIKPNFLFFSCISVYLLFVSIVLNAQVNQIDPIQKIKSKFKRFIK